ncbi:PREDICTED: glycine N-acyltransferase-like isoform X2 [Nanorana parkeri]|uniref:glycine N-acyltransferase-like isoform X2 n=1 Tax=Nanorana parkeri TaxID=125878 RepID=UPI000853F896|nr:PREDICTED: glycine N-acyltransferase-like isoform X2 [Nanorana parkeri]
MTWTELRTTSCISIIMISLTCSSKLASLRKLLSYSFPESLKVYGALHHEMKDPLDHYTNTYFVFSKDPESLRHMLEEPQTVNWSQKFQIQGCQTALGEVFHSVLSKHGGHMMTVSNVLYIRDRKINADEVEALSNTRTSDLQFSPLNPDEAPLVSAQWLFGGNELSENYIRRCIQMFPNLCARKPGVSRPIAWVLSEQSAEIRMGYTESPYRSQRLFANIATRLLTIQQSRGTPIYCHVASDNKKSQSATMAVGFIPVGRWQQWSFQPS